MIEQELMMVRVYLTESEHNAHLMLDYLQKSGVMGASLLRGISGFGASGTMHRAEWLDISGDLPLLLEFADEPAKVKSVLPGLLEMTEPGHVFCWKVNTFATENE